MAKSRKRKWTTGEKVAAGAGVLVLGAVAYSIFHNKGQKLFVESIWNKPFDSGILSPPYVPPSGGGGNAGVSGRKYPGVPSDAQLQDPKEIEKVLKTIASDYGSNLARNVEKIYRLETDNFTSGQYLATGSPGMVAATDNYPYGWNSLREMWDKYEWSRPLGYVNFPSVNKKFIAFKGAGGYAALAAVLQMRNNIPGAWYSTDPQQQAWYENVLNAPRFAPKFV